jgi:hypothetical protein
MTIVIIDWTDSASHGDRTQYKGDEKELRALTGVSAGLLVRENDESLSIAMDWFEEIKEYRTLMTVPKCSVSRIQRIEPLDRAVTA